jgi:hypothetical protein
MVLWSREVGEVQYRGFDQWIDAVSQRGISGFLIEDGRVMEKVVVATAGSGRLGSPEAKLRRVLGFESTGRSHCTYYFLLAIMRSQRLLRVSGKGSNRFILC